MIKKIKILVFILLINTVIYAHPHVFMEPKIFLDMNQNKITDAKISVTLDEMSSMIYLDDYDKNADEKFDENEKKEFKKEVLNNFTGKNKHIYLRINAKEQEVKTKNFKLWVEDDVIHYSVDVVMNREIQPTDDIIFSLYDNTYFISYDYGQENMKFKDPSKIAFVDCYDNKKISYYFGNVNPINLEVVFK